MIDVAVIDDDFRVARLHAMFVERVPGFQVAGLAHTEAEGRALVERVRPDLVLLDHYLPDGSGLELARELRCDVLLVTAGAAAGAVHAAVTAGAIGYLLKPFRAEQLAERLRAYQRYRGLLGPDPDAELAQATIDRALAALTESSRAPVRGQSAVTTRLVAEALQAAAAPSTAAEISQRLGIARATAQRYLAALVDDGSAAMRLRYGSTGRPEHEYTWLTDD